MKIPFGLFFVALLCLSSVELCAQQNSVDVIYLRNKWIIRGSILSQDQEEVTIRSVDGNIFVFKKPEVLSMTREQEKFRPAFGHYTEIGALAATKNRPDNVTTAAFTFQTVNGYAFSPYLFTGIGVAVDLYATQTTVPVFASVRSNLFKTGRFVPYLFADGGYGFDITSSTTTIEYRSGMMYAMGLGFKIPLGDRAGFHVNAGYRVQKGATVESGVENKYTNERIAVRAGFYL